VRNHEKGALANEKTVWIEIVVTVVLYLPDILRIRQREVARYRW